jgi:hypothetical protein
MSSPSAVPPDIVEVIVDPLSTLGSETLMSRAQCLLADQGITYNETYGNWVRTTQQGRGVTSETADPIAELGKLDNMRSQRQYTNSCGSGALPDEPYHAGHHIEGSPQPKRVPVLPVRDGDGGP